MLAESQLLVIKRGFSVAHFVYYNCASQKKKKEFVMICQLLHVDTFKEPLKSIMSDLRVLGNALK